MPPWLNNRVKEEARENKTSFKNWKSNSSEENRKEHKLWQVKCKNTIRQAKKEFEEHFAKDTKTKSNNILSTSEAGSLLNNQWSHWTMEVLKEHSR